MGKRGSVSLFAPPRVATTQPIIKPAAIFAPAPSISLFANNPVSSLTKEAGFLALTAPAQTQAAPAYVSGLFATPPSLVSDKKFLLNAPSSTYKPLNYNLLAPSARFSAAPIILNAPSSRIFPPITAQKPIQKPQQPITTPSPSPSPNLPFNSPILSGLGGLGFGFGGGAAVARVKTGGGGIGRKERGGLFGKTRYSASLGSVLTGYTKKGNAAKLSKQSFSGIGLRPLLEKEDKKKKKKKKK
jgi:hypothetical protein